MKKILISLFITLGLFSLASAESVVPVTISGAVTSTGVQDIDVASVNSSGTGTILEISSATTENGENALASPVENATYTYYYGQTCPYCQSLNKYLESVDGYNKLNIEKREVWHNRNNAAAMAEDIKRLGIENNTNIGVPFIIINDGGKDTYLTGLDQAMAHFEPILGVYDKEKIEAEIKEKKEIISEQTKGNQMIFLVIVLILAIAIPLIFILPKKK